MQEHNEEKKGILYALAAFIFWGLVPIYFKLTSSVLPAEVLVHRIVWSVVFLALLIGYTKQSRQVLAILKDWKKVRILMITSILVSSNWLIFIWAISHDMITEASLGYYINPIISILLGIIFFGEIPSKLQKIAILLAFLAILNELISVGSIPLVSLSLASLFAFYGMLRKKISLPSVAGLFIETLVILPFALLYFYYLVSTSQNTFDFTINTVSILLISAGLITVLPLLWFNAAATRISLTKLGFIQYVGPSISFLLGIFVYHEPFDQKKLLTFLLIWLALVLFSFDSKLSKKRFSH
ncbi:EamA family transporter RarD [Sulfurospirillum sp. 1612]|uniref:EamA family transporter RarD n=1 Tax=Sulfurospirillum sp. 1612 TaxID=3094835 RepID=UPI002F93D76B